MANQVPVPSCTARLGDVLDLENVREHIMGRYIELRHHRAGGLLILDYGRATQFEQKWDRETLTCRGFMVTEDPSSPDGLSEDSLIAARGYEKFFTPEQHAQLAEKGILPPLPVDETFEVFTKEDGSLGIGYLAHDGRPAISTRGSFHSVQAQWATDHLRAHPELEDAVGRIIERGTPCFEIISPVSQIVKIYDFHGLMLHGVVDRATGRLLPFGDEWPGRVVQSHDPTKLEEMLALDMENEEGFVIRYASGAAEKRKNVSYLRLHALVTGASTTMLWEHLAVAAVRDEGLSEKQAVTQLGVDHRVVARIFAATGDPFEEMLQQVPDEFDSWVRMHVTALRDAHAARERELRELFETIPQEGSPKEFAERVKHLPKNERSAMFSLSNSQSISAQVWKHVRPEYSKAFAVDIDA